MQWSKLKRRIEESFADSVKGRVQVWATRYRHSHDQVGESWITIDKVRVVSMGTQSYFNEYYGTAHRLRTEGDCLDYRDPGQKEGYYKAYDEAEKATQEKGIFPSWELGHSIREFLRISIDEALASGNPIIRTLAVLDHRFGKRRLIEFDPTEEHPMVVQMYQFRCSAEGLVPHPNQSSNSDPAAAEESDYFRP